MNTTHYRIPKRFVQDHENRSCLRHDDGSEYGKEISIEDVLVKETKTHYVLDLNKAQVDELLSDADYYASGSDQEDIGLRSSARATLKALLDQGVTPIKKIHFVY